MGKVAPEPLVSQRTHSGRSYWVRNILASTRDNAADPPPAAKAVPKSPATKKRFVEPYRLSDEQRAAMLAPLAERGIGDPESRELFAAALAYDLATCYELTVANAEPAVTAPVPVPPADDEGEEPSRRTAATAAARHAAPDPELTDLAEAARALAARLDTLGAEARARLLQGLRETDLFRRGYDDAYLSALRGELLRLAQDGAAADAEQATSPAQAAPPPKAPARRPPAPKPSPAARQFIARAAGAFEQCFDQAPTAQVGGPFAAMLKTLVSITGVRIPTDARNLAEMLRRA